MIAVVQRVSQAAVFVDGKQVGAIGPGLCVLLGVDALDSEADAAWLAEKIVNLRIFEDDAGKMNRGLMETGGQMLVVSQFTLLGDCRKGKRPSFVKAAPPEKGRALYERFVGLVKDKGVATQTGIFGAMMEVKLNNSGP
ncbi:MAG: D-aminoacyl-tRNA deacylase, partial [Desulfatibacillaceae bacterium]|nr:D-aminoacyl-tRNA deacylase [Desulfatibacillaceae bacterium]